MEQESFKTEILFWLVFRNIYINQQIFQQIHNTEWVEHEDPNKIRVDNRCKFKDTHSLGVMIKNGLYSLLKLKIETNEYIEFDKESIKILFLKFSTLRTTPPSPSPSQSQSQTLITLENKEDSQLMKNKIERKQLKDILILLLKYRRFEFEICNLPDLAVFCHSVDVLKILFKFKPYGSIGSMVIYPKTIEFAIQRSTPNVLNQLIKIIKSSTTTPTSDENTTIINKDNTLESAFSNYQYSDEMVKIILDNNLFTKSTYIFELNYAFLLSMKCNYSVNKLMDLKLVVYKGGQYRIQKYIKFLDSFETLSRYVRIHFEYTFYYIEECECIEVCNCGVNDGSIDDDDDEESQSESNDAYHQDYITFKNIQKITDESIRLKKLHTFIGEKFEMDHSYYEDYYCLYNEKIKGFPFQNKVFPNRIEIFQLKKAIGNCDLETLKKCNGSFIKNLTFIGDNIELPNSIDDINRLVQFLNGDANGNGDGDGDALKQFDRFNLSCTNFYGDLVKIIPPSNINLHLNKINETEGSLGSFDFLMRDAFCYSVKIKLIELFLHNINDLSDFQNKFNFPITSLEESIERGKIFLGNKSLSFLNLKSSATPNEIISIIQLIIKKFSALSKLEEAKIMKTIEITDQLGIPSELTYSNKDDYQKLLNYFYSLLVKIKGVQIQDVLKARSLLESDGIEIKHTIYHSTYYIQIRSAKLIKYIQSNPLNIAINNSTKNVYINASSFTFDYLLKGSFNSSKNGTIYQFDTPFDLILNKLSISLLVNEHLPKENSNENIKLSFQSDLNYFLNIRRIDLFWNRLELIYNYNNNYNNNNKNGVSILLTNEYFYNSPFEKLKSTSKLFENERDQIDLIPLLNHPIVAQFNEVTFNNNLILKACPIVAVFKIPDQTLELLCKIITIEDFEKLIKYQFYISNFIDKIYKISISCYRWDLVRFLIENFNIDLLNSIRGGGGGTNLNITYLGFKFLVENNYIFNNSSSNQQSIENGNETVQTLFLSCLIDYLFSTDGVLIKFSNQIDALVSKQFNHSNDQVDVVDNVIDLYLDFKNKIQGYHQLEFNIDQFENNINLIKPLVEVLKKEEVQIMLKKRIDSFKSQQYKEGEEEEDLKKTIFYKTFIKGDIRFCDFLLNQYPNQFTISKLGITDAVNNNNIQIIKYYYNIYIKNNNELLNLLKDLLKTHENYKYDFNWL
ncbi:hypothetical protein ACTFIW_008318 [Dictyostelium discoideum]